MKYLKRSLKSIATELRAPVIWLALVCMLAIPVFMLVSGLWFIGLTGSACWVAGVFFTIGLFLWIVSVAEKDDRHAQILARVALGILLGSSWGLGGSIFGEVFLDIERIER